MDQLIEDNRMYIWDFTQLLVLQYLTLFQHDTWLTYHVNILCGLSGNIIGLDVHDEIVCVLWKRLLNLVRPRLE